MIVQLGVPFVVFYDPALEGSVDRHFVLGRANHCPVVYLRKPVLSQQARDYVEAHRIHFHQSDEGDGTVDFREQFGHVCSRIGSQKTKHLVLALRRIDIVMDRGVLLDEFPVRRVCRRPGVAKIRNDTVHRIADQRYYPGSWLNCSDSPHMGHFDMPGARLVGARLQFPRELVDSSVHLLRVRQLYVRGIDTKMFMARPQIGKFRCERRSGGSGNVHEYPQGAGRNFAVNELRERKFL